MIRQLLDRSRAAITGKIYGVCFVVRTRNQAFLTLWQLVSEGWQPKALQKRRSIAELYDEDTKENFKILDTPLHKPRAQNGPAKRRRSGVSENATPSASSGAPDIQRMCVICSHSRAGAMFECLQCSSLYHEMCLNDIKANNALNGTSWTCIRCTPPTVDPDQLANSTVLLGQIECQLLAAISSVRQFKGQCGLDDLRRELFQAQEELHQCRKRMKRLEEELSEAKAALVGT